MSFIDFLLLPLIIFVVRIIYAVNLLYCYALGILSIQVDIWLSAFLSLQKRDARVTINAIHPGIVKTGIVRAHTGFITGMKFYDKVEPQEIFCKRRRRKKSNFCKIFCRFFVFHCIEATEDNIPRSSNDMLCVSKP